MVLTFHPTIADGLLEGPTADFDEKGGGSMPESLSPISQFQFLPFREEVQTYLRSCEHLLSVPAVPHNHPPFSPDELEIMNYYAAEVAKMVGRLAEV